MKKIKLSRWDSLPLIDALPVQKEQTTWAFATQKGGVGKTTMAWMFTELINSVSDTGTLLVNYDGQTNVIDTALKADGEEAMIDTRRYITSLDLFDLNVDDDDNIIPSSLMDKELYKNSRGIYLIPSNASFKRIDLLEDDTAHLAAPYINLGYLTKKHGIGNTILDCQPHLGFAVKSGLFVSDYVIPPTLAHEYSVSGFAAMCHQLRSANMVRKDLELPPIKMVGFLINLYKKDSAKVLAHLTGLREQLGSAVLDTILPDRGTIQDSTSVGLPIWENRRAGSPIAAKEVLDAINEILDRASKMFQEDSDPNDEIVLMLADYHEATLV